jgi:hypothetical protein
MYAADMLGSLGMPEDLIEEVRGMLASRASELEGAEPSPIGEVFGGSAQGALLNHHAALARRHVADAVLEMAAGMRGYRAELGLHRARMDSADAQSAVDLRRIEKAAACVAPASFATDDACTLPTSSPRGEG